MYCSNDALSYIFNVSSSFQIRNLEEAVQELWRRRDEADKDLIVSLRAAAGLPTQEEIFDISPFSDDEESGPPLVKNDFGRSLKFSLKGLGNKSPKKSKEHGKKSSNKKYSKKKGNETSLTGGADTYQNLDGYIDGPSGQNTGNNKNDNMLSTERTFSPIAGSLMDDASATNEAAASKHKYIDEVSATNITKASRTIKIKSNKSFGSTNKEEIGSNSGLPKTAHGPKLVIHLGGRSKNTSPPRSEASSLKKGQEKTSSKGALCVAFISIGIFVIYVYFIKLDEQFIQGYYKLLVRCFWSLYTVELQRSLGKTNMIVFLHVVAYIDLK